jgi:hypothetical protein
MRLQAVTVEERTALIPLHSDTGRCFALVDADDAIDVISRTWFRHRRTGYPTHRTGSGVLVTMHSSIQGPPPKGLVIDHINGDKLDNRRSNLRLLTVSANGLNRHRANANNRSSAVPGVSWCKGTRKWRVQVRSQGKDHFGGYFGDEAAAIAAAQVLRACLLHGNSNRRRP